MYLWAENEIELLNPGGMYVERDICIRTIVVGREATVHYDGHVFLYNNVNQASSPTYNHNEQLKHGSAS
jgi:hypothetical protein